MTETTPETTIVHRSVEHVFSTQHEGEVGQIDVLCQMIERIDEAARLRVLLYILDRYDIEVCP